MKLTIEKWLQRIADPVIRESALSQMDEWKKDCLCDNIGCAILRFKYWEETEEGWSYWHAIRLNPPALLPLSETPDVVYYEPLYQHMADKHGLKLTESELSDIVDVVKHYLALLNER